MSSDATIKFDGVEGESPTVKGEVDVMSWAWGVSQPAGTISSAGSGKGKAVPGDFHFTHMYDKSSPILAKKCAQGVHFPSVKLTARKAGEGQQAFLTVTMKEVFVTSVQPAGSSGGDIMESVSFSYKEVEFAYKPQDDKGGLGGEVKFGWNVATTAVT